MSRRSGRAKAYSDISDESLKVLADDDANTYEAEGEEDEEQEITRCVCGQDELNPKSINQQLASLIEVEYEIKIDSGLFIQCDKCSVWQHGYCVGLFTDEDVPDKYWCELCKPDLHILSYEPEERARTFYKLVNDKRKKLLVEFATENGKGGNRTRTKRVSSGSPAISKAKPHRKERRHLDDEYDEQLQKALRESAKESGIFLEEDAKNKKRSKSEESEESNKKTKVENKRKDQNNGNIDEDNDNETDVQAKSEPKKSKASNKTKSKSKKSNSPVAKTSNDAPSSRDELINQASKPRYVSDKSSIYELRKRTGAILEWLGRSQMELEEQKLNKIELYSYKEKSMDESQEINEENNKVIEIFNENLKLMEKLTDKILSWEQKFGKYAP